MLLTEHDWSSQFPTKQKTHESGSLVMKWGYLQTAPSCVLVLGRRLPLLATTVIYSLLLLSTISLRVFPPPSLDPRVCWPSLTLSLPSSPPQMAIIWLLLRVVLEALVACCFVFCQQEFELLVLQSQEVGPLKPSWSSIASDWVELMAELKGDPSTHFWTWISGFVVVRAGFAAWFPVLECWVSPDCDFGLTWLF